MRKSFRAYALAGLAATTAGILASPALTNLYLDGQTLLYAAMLITLGGAAAAVWAAGPEERRTRLMPWLACGFTAGLATGVILALVAGLGFFLAIGLGARFGAWVTLIIAFSAAALSLGAAYGAFWLSWRHLAPRPAPAVA